MKLLKYIVYFIVKQCGKMAALFLVLAGLPAYAEVNQLENIGFSSLPGDKIQINLDFSAHAQAPVSFSTDNPARVVLDFPNAISVLKKKKQIIGAGAVQSINTIQANGRTRVVLNLVRKSPFHVNTEGKQVFVSFTGSVAQAIPAPRPLPIQQAKVQPTAPPQYSRLSEPSSSGLKPVSLATPTVLVKQPVYRGPEIKNVDFRRTDEGAGRIIITLSDPNTVISMREQGQSILLDIPNTHLPEKLDRRLDVVDFGTPIKAIDTASKGDNTRMAISVVGEYEHLAYQSGDTYTLEVKKVEAVADASGKKLKKPSYKGQKVSFNFQNIEVRSALLLLTDLPGVHLNIIVNDTVTGNITLRLKNVPWDQALDIILESRDLGMRRIDNVIMVDLKVNINEREKRELAAQQEIKKLEPLRTEFIRVNYSKAEDLRKLLQSSSTGSGKTGHSFLSDRGNVSIDERTNTLIIQDTNERLQEIRQLINSLDTPVRQVLIESRVVIASDDFGQSLGVRFGYSANKDLGNGYGAVVGGKARGDTVYSSGTAFQTTGGGTTGSEGYIVSLPETLASGQSAALGLAIGKIGTYLLQLELSALQTENRGEIIASPRVITANQKKASIIQGTQIPYRGSAGVGATAEVEFKDAVLKLEVTPQITPDDRIIMDLLVSKDAPSTINIAGGSEIAIDKREVTTQVLVDNGETVVLGGVYEQTLEHNVSRVPFLSDLPLVGNLFRNRTKKDEKSELLIFVTPKILKEKS